MKSTSMGSSMALGEVAEVKLHGPLEHPHQQGCVGGVVIR